MCSISGGTKWDNLSRIIWERSRNRGRDDEGRSFSFNSWIGNRRAIPTTEEVDPIEKQPVGNDPIQLVFNGIISNDHELGLKAGEADTSVLPRVLDFSSLEAFADSLNEKVIGSFAIAVLDQGSGKIWLACNYKPIWIYHENDEWYFSSLENHFKGFSGELFKMPPYSVCELGTKEFIPLKRKQSNKAIVICSAGLDSTTVASVAIEKHGASNVLLLHFNYGCKATSKEVESILKLADYFCCGFEIIPFQTFGGSSLLSEHAHISEGITGAEYAHEWVPARNLVMLSLAVSYAEAKEYGHIYLGTNLEEAGAYPDNEEQFILDFNNLLYGAVQNGVKIEIHTPLGGLMKHEIVKLGGELNTPFHLTWSCYHAGEKHCGKCGPCFMRQKAFERNGLIDPVFKQK